MGKRDNKSCRASAVLTRKVDKLVLNEEFSYHVDMELIMNSIFPYSIDTFAHPYDIVFGKQRTMEMSFILIYTKESMSLVCL